MKKVSFWQIWDDIQEVRKRKWNKEAIDLANFYIWKNPFDLQAYLQLMDIYYVMWELEKAEKPLDFILSQKISDKSLDLNLMYYIKAVLLSERTQWTEAKKYIKLALKISNNPEYIRLLANIEFWSWNKTRWYNLLQDVLENHISDADILLDWVTMALSLWYKEDAKEYVSLYFKNKEKISFFSKSKSYYDKKMQDFKTILFD